MNPTDQFHIDWSWDYVNKLGLLPFDMLLTKSRWSFQWQIRLSLLWDAEANTVYFNIKVLLMIFSVDTIVPYNFALAKHYKPKILLLWLFDVNLCYFLAKHCIEYFFKQNITYKPFYLESSNLYAIWTTFLCRFQNFNQIINWSKTTWVIVIWNLLINESIWHYIFSSFEHLNGC